MPTKTNAFFLADKSVLVTDGMKFGDLPENFIKDLQDKKIEVVPSTLGEHRFFFKNEDGSLVPYNKIQNELVRYFNISQVEKLADLSKQSVTLSDKKIVINQKWYSLSINLNTFDSEKLDLELSKEIQAQLGKLDGVTIEILSGSSSTKLTLISIRCANKEQDDQQIVNAINAGIAQYKSKASANPINETLNNKLDAATLFKKTDHDPAATAPVATPTPPVAPATSTPPSKSPRVGGIDLSESPLFRKAAAATGATLPAGLPVTSSATVPPIRKPTAATAGAAKISSGTYSPTAPATAPTGTHTHLTLEKIVKKFHIAPTDPNLERIEEKGHAGTNISYKLKNKTPGKTILNAHVNTDNGNSSINMHDHNDKNLIHFANELLMLAGHAASKQTPPNTMPVNIEISGFTLDAVQKIIKHIDDNQPKTLALNVSVKGYTSGSNIEIDGRLNDINAKNKSGTKPTI